LLLDERERALSRLSLESATEQKRRLRKRLENGIKLTKVAESDLW